LKVISNHPAFHGHDRNIHGVSIDKNILTVDDYPDRVLFMFHDGKYYFISDNIRFLRRLSRTGFSTNGLIQLAIYQASLYPYSIYKDIITLPLSSKIIFNRSGYEIKRLPKKQKPVLDVEGAVDRLNSVFKKDLANIGDRPYHMYSGGVDSSIVFYHLRDKDTVAGTSIYTRTDAGDLSGGISYFNELGDFEQNLIHLDEKDYLNTIDKYHYYIPYVCPGTIDDLFHARDAIKLGCNSIVNGHGSDELMAAYLFEERKDISDPDYYLEKYSKFKLKFLMTMFDAEKVYDTIEDSMRELSFKTLKDKIHWVNVFHQVPLQLSLMMNNSILMGNIPRYMPFSSRDFFDIVMSLPEELIAQNGIAEYILRYWARDFLPIRLWAKEKKTFEVDNEKIIDACPSLVKDILDRKLDNISQKTGMEDVNKVKEQFDELFANEKIIFLLYISMINDFQT